MGPSYEQDDTTGDCTFLAKLAGSSTSLAVRGFITYVLFRALVGTLPMCKGFAAVEWYHQVVLTV